MNKGNLNKLVTNYPVELTEKEISNLSGTLAPVIAACGGGGGGTGGKIYTGVGFVNVNNTTNQIGLTEAANTKLNQDIPTKVSDLSDSANYQTVAGMDQYLTEVEAQSLYLTKSSADNDYAPLNPTTADIEALKAISGLYYPKTQTSSDSELATEFAKYATRDWTDNNFITEQELGGRVVPIVDGAGFAYKTYVDGELDKKENKLTFAYDNNKISAINGSALAGQGGTTYTEGDGITIANDIISISADYIEAITSISSIKGTVLTGDANIRTTSAESGNNIVWTMELTAQPVVTDTTLSGHQGIVAVKDSNVSSQWNVSIAQAYREEIEAVSGKLTKSSADTLYSPITVTGDVNTLTDASANWNEVSAKLGTAQYANDSATFLTAHQSLTNYYTKSDTSSKSELSTEFAKYQPTGDYATTALLNTISSTLTGVDDELSDHINYVS